MHPISDRELDQLFQQKFESAEFEPSAGLWDRINGELDQPAKQRSRVPVLWMAASVLILISAGLWFYHPQEVIHLQGRQQQQLVQNVEPAEAIAVRPFASVTVVKEKPQTAYVRRTLAIESLKTEEVPVTEESIDRQAEEPVVAVRTTVRRNSSPEPVAKAEVKVPERYYGDLSQLDVTQPDLVASAETEYMSESYSADNKPARRIKSIGGLVNYVIAKVDRREDKLIEFKDSEEGSEVAGINLGLLKLKNRNK